MRNFINILNEAERGKSSKTLDNADDATGKYNFLNGLQAKPDAALSVRPDAPVSSRRKAKASPTLPGKQAVRRKTAAGAALGAAHTMTPDLANSMSAIASSGMEDEMSDADAARHAGLGQENPLRLGRDQAAVGHERGARDLIASGGDATVEPTNDNLPMLVNHDLALTGPGPGRPVEPTWHQVKHLPGYMQNAIRAMGRQVFRQFTDTPIEDIQMLCTMLNPESEVKAVMNWVRVNGVMDDRADMTFPGGIGADVRLWKTADFSFLLVKDPMGIYVYGWAGGRGVHVGHTDTKRLGRS